MNARTMNLMKKKLNKMGVYVLAILLCVYVLAPYLWLIISSISTKTDLITKPLRWFPQNPTLETYLKIFKSSANTTDAASQFKYALLNSLIIALSSSAIALIAGVLSAYAFARFRFRGKNTLFHSAIITQMIPPVRSEERR